MAKGARASTRKRNNQNLRARVFGPAHDARTERLSAKLQEIASRPILAEERVMELDGTKSRGEDAAAVDGKESDEMDIDAQGTRSRATPSSSKPSQKTRPGRIEKKIAKRKAKSSIVFPPNPHKKKRLMGNARKS